MTISDTIHETMISLIREALDYHHGNVEDLAKDRDVLEVVAVHLKVGNRMGHIRPTSKDIERINAVDWMDEAHKFIIGYFKEQEQKREAIRRDMEEIIRNIEKTIASKRNKN